MNGSHGIFAMFTTKWKTTENMRQVKTLKVEKKNIEVVNCFVTRLNFI